MKRLATKVTTKAAKGVRICLGKARRSVSAASDYSQHKICHFSFHKNLTVYYARVAEEFAVETGRKRKHFKSYKDRFLRNPSLDIRSVNNHFINIEDSSNFAPSTRFSLFLRDPRDLVVSGYHYHKRGAERWCNQKNPTEKTLKTVNLALPSQYLKPGETVSDAMQRIDIDTGLQMEIEMRKPHFETLRNWIQYAKTSDRLLVQTYDDIVADNVGCFENLAVHYEFTNKERSLWKQLAEKYSAKNISGKHIRDPSPQQWKKTLNDQHIQWFEENYPDLVSYFTGGTEPERNSVSMTPSSTDPNGSWQNKRASA